MKFMKIDDFPTYDLQTKSVSIEIANAHGYDSIATTHYQASTNSHTLVVSTNLILEKHLLFHEFTHILDSEYYVHGDKMRYAGLSGFTEYHASQIELLQLVGANSFDETISFSMNHIITSISGEKTVAQYVDEKRLHAIELFSREDFPANIDALKSAFGVLFNYFGLRSICKMYCTDYIETIDNSAFMKHISSFNYIAINNLMQGWLDDEKIDKSIHLYIKTVFPLITQYRLT
ncbi:MAG: hypothetical protein IJA67_14360 [Oscillospiraceae bacterium]|nr:hypothetical protein [Oscillospiraceae bacterium]